MDKLVHQGVIRPILNHRNIFIDAERFSEAA